VQSAAVDKWQQQDENRLMARRRHPIDPGRTWTFTLVLSGVRELTGEVEDALFEAGCADALLGSRDGAVYLDFDRQSPSFREAVLSAIADVENAGVGARVARVEPDEVVTMAEIARRWGRSRESVRQLVAGLRGPGTFPPPVANLKQRSPIWRWTDVDRWLHEALPGEGTPLPREACGEDTGTVAPDVGVWVAAINAALDVRRHVPDAQEALRLVETLLTPHRPC
jgi:hypothetical protein